jgi:hypothetical protein
VRGSSHRATIGCESGALRHGSVAPRLLRHSGRDAVKIASIDPVVVGRLIPEQAIIVREKRSRRRSLEVVVLSVTATQTQRHG